MTVSGRTTGGNVAVVVCQHAQDAVTLRNTRSFLVRAPHVKLHQLGRIDERLSAHLDGISVAGAYGSALAMSALDSPGSAELFVATVCAVQDRDFLSLERVIALGQALPEARQGLFSALGWVPGSSLQGIFQHLLALPGVFPRQVGLAACATHHVDPGTMLLTSLNDPDAGLRAQALRATAQIGRVELMPNCVSALKDESRDCVLEAACAAVLLGHRGSALAVLRDFALARNPLQGRALDVLLKVLAPADTHDLVGILAKDPADSRCVIWSLGVAGDVHGMPWLMQQMHDPKLARIAGEAVSLITGLDLVYLDMDRNAPTGFASGPSDDPEEDQVAMDEDEGLPWPDPEKIAAWWQAHGNRFIPGTRYFMGQPPSPAHCLSVLKTGFQRQRSAAAVYRSLLQPGTPLFNTAAPAWRQQQSLHAMGA